MNTLPLIAPTDLRDFIKAHGWTLKPEGLASRLYVLENSKFPRRQMIFPMDMVATDYSETVLSVIEKMAELLYVSPAILLARIQAAKDDVLRFRVFTGVGGDNSVPLSFAVTLVDGVQQLLKAAACNVVAPRIHHSRLASTDAIQLIEKTRFDQTEAGSFVLKIACPVHAIDAKQLPLEPFVRQVTASLHTSLNTLVQAIEADTLDGFIDDLKHSPTPLLSSNLCEALASLQDSVLGNSLDVSFDWSVLVAAPENAARPIRLQRDYFPRIEEIGRALRPVESHREDVFVGTVEHLAGVMGDDGRRYGEVELSLMFPDGAGIVRAKAMLSADQYADADRAHMQDGIYVKVAGRLHPGRQPRVFDQISHFSLINTDGYITA